MNKFFKTLSIALSVSIALVSCDKEDELQNLVEQETTAEVIFDTATGIELTDEQNNGLYLTIEYNKETNTSKLISYEEKELDFFPLYSSQ